MADEETVSYLTAWGLEKYIPIFYDNGMTRRGLAMMTGEVAKDLIPSAEDRTQFLFHIEQWRSTFLIAEGISSSSSEMFFGESSNVSAPSSSSDNILKLKKY